MTTPLDLAHAAMEAAPEDDAARLTFHERLADGELFLLLEAEPDGDIIKPRLFELEDGPVVLAFDREDRLADFTGVPAPYVALPGRVVARHLAGQGVGIGLNLGVAPSSYLLSAAAVDWLAQMLDHAPKTAEARPSRFLAPRAVPERLLQGLDAKLARAGGLAAAALLAAVDYADGRRGHILAFVDARPGAEQALAHAVAEALTFSSVEAGELDVTFLSAEDPALAALAPVALHFDLQLPEPAETAAPAAPGSDPDRPPILR